MKESLRVSVGAVVLALATLAAVIFAWLNFVQRSHYDMVDDGVAWSDSPSGIEAWKIVDGKLYLSYSKGVRRNGSRTYRETSSRPTGIGPIFTNERARASQ